MQLKNKGLFHCTDYHVDCENSRKRYLGRVKLGVDDYITKPFSPKELVARVETVLRRIQPEYREEKWSSKKVCCLLTRIENKVFKQGEEIILTPTEVCFISPSGLTSKAPIFTGTAADAKGLDFDGTDRVIDTHIKNIRQKIEDDTRNPYFILTAYGMGYRFGGQK